MSLTIRTLGRDEIRICLDFAAAEGWNPGLYDAAAFYAADNDGFFAAELDGETIGCISAVRYETFGFIGLFIVREDQRRHGYGAALWDYAMHHLHGLPVGLDAVLAQEARYEKLGLQRSFLSVRYRCDVREPRDRVASKVALERVRTILAASALRVLIFCKRGLRNRTSSRCRRVRSKPASCSVTASAANAARARGSARSLHRASTSPRCSSIRSRNAHVHRGFSPSRSHI
jgi:GNAT superfamily N-acetyltransferase